METDLHLCVYNTQLFDSLLSIAQEYSPYPSEEGVAQYLKVLLQINQFNQEGSVDMIQDPSFPIRHGMNICLPYVKDFEKYREISQLEERFLIDQWLMEKEPTLETVRSVNEEGWHTREVVSHLIESYDLQTVASIALLAQAIKRDVQDHQELFTGASLTLGEQAADHVSEEAKKIKEAMIKAEDKLKSYLAAPYGEKTTAKKEFFEAHKEVKEKFAEYLNEDRGKRIPGFKRLEFVNNRDTWITRVRTGLPLSRVMDTEAYSALVKTARYGKIFARAFTCLQITLNSIEVYHTYREGGDWMKEAFEDIGGLALGAAGALTAIELASILLTPAGWIVILIGAMGAEVSEGYGKEWGGGIFNWGKGNVMNFVNAGYL